MAAGLGFKDFVTGEVLTAADVDGYLMQGIWVFASAAARSAAVTSPQEGNYSYLKDTNSTEYYTGSAWVAAGGGGGGKVLQVVQGTYATATTIATNTYTDTGLSLSITPTSATSKVLVMINQAFVFSRSATSQGASIQILRGASSVFASGADDTWYLVAGTDGTSINLGTVGSLVYLDSPATTSATTYKTQGRSLRTTSSAQVVFQPDSNKNSVITLMEIGA